MEIGKWKIEGLNAEFAESVEYAEMKREETPFGGMAFPGVSLRGYAACGSVLCERLFGG
jgi:hypothetical protein